MNEALLSELQQEAWGVEPNALKAFFLKAAAITPEEARTPGAPGPLSILTLDGETAVIPVKGMLLKNVPNWARSFATGYTDISAAMGEAVANPAVKRIVLHVSSPGGMVSGVEEAGNAIHAARQVKDVSAVVEDLCASAAYWLASQTGSIKANSTADIGSIGVYTVAYDYSKMAEMEGISVKVIASGEHKGMGVPGAPITDSQVAAVKEIVDGKFGLFVGAIQRGRGMSAEKLMPLATGRMWLASVAKEHGLIDDVMSVSEAMANVRSGLMDKTRSQEMEDKEKAAQDLEKARSEAAAQALDGERARLKALAAAFPEDAAFALEHAQAGSTVDQAKAAYADKLQETLKAERAEKKSLEDQLAAAQKSGSKGKEQGGGAGAPPLAHGEGGSASGDFLEVAKARAKEEKISLTAAMRLVSKEQPELHRAFVRNGSK